MTSPKLNFDRIARSYRWLEYFTLGRALERCRFHFLPNLSVQRRALVLGDGDGRFLARLFQQNSAMHADAVDISARMLSLLGERCHRACPSAANRLKTHHADALTFLATPPDTLYDLVVTHFMLDCLTESELAQLISSVAACLTPDGLWLVSEFRIPDGPMRLPATLLVRFLYLAFHLLTGLRVNRLPDHHAALTTAGFSLQACHTSLFGTLSTDLWRFNSRIGGKPAQAETSSASSIL